MPKFSIILPVRNGGEYVKLCVKSILDQTYHDFELLVLDNASTDGTSEWFESLRDPRIKIFPSSVPLGIEENWKRALAIPKSEFMTLIGHDDLLKPDYLEKMNALIALQPGAGLYQSHFNYINASGRQIRPCRSMPGTISAAEFLQLFLEDRIDVMGTGFLMRSADYDREGGIPDYPNLLFADFEIWINLTRRSFLAVSPEECFSFRLHQSMTTRSGDQRFFQAYQRFVAYLKNLSQENEEYNKIIRQAAPRFLLFYCRGLSHRLLRTPKNKRNGMTVNAIIEKTREFASTLGITGLEPLSVFSIRIAKWIDSFAITRFSFLLFKSVFKKPIMK